MNPQLLKEQNEKRRKAYAADVAANVQDISNLEQLQNCLNENISKVCILNADDRDKMLDDQVKSAQSLQGKVDLYS